MQQFWTITILALAVEKFQATTIKIIWSVVALIHI
jgi:hypothetical protein